MHSRSRIGVAVGAAVAALFAVASCGGGADEKPEPSFGFGFRPAWSPNGRWIAFETAPLVPPVSTFGSRLSGLVADYTRTEIWLVKAAGGQPRKLASGQFAAWSDDSRRILFTAATGPAQAAVVTTDGTRMRKLTDRESFAPSWSPDGRRMAWVQIEERGANSYELWAANADGTSARRLSRSPVESSNPLLFERPYSWSPDGRKLAFAVAWTGGDRLGYYTYGRTCNALHVVDADGTGERRISRSTLEFAWSPSGRQIAFVSCDAERDALFRERLYVARVDGVKAARLVATADAEEPGSALGGVSWSPDERALAFVRSGDFGGRWVTVVTPTGQHLASAPSGDWGGPWTYEGAVRWSPDGQFAFRCRPPGICAMTRHGSRPRRLTGAPVAGAPVQTAPAWSPDGDRIAFAWRGAIYVVDADGVHRRRIASVPRPK